MQIPVAGVAVVGQAEQRLDSGANRIEVDVVADLP